MALVADYEISDEEMEAEDSPDAGPGGVVLVQGKGNSSAEPGPSASSSAAGVKTRVVPFFEEDSSGDEEGSDAVLEKFLPKPKTGRDLEEEEEIGPIPPKKSYGDEEEKPPPPPTYHTNLSVKRVKGQMIIAAPSLKDFENDEEEASSSSRFRQASQKGSGLFAMLPQPRGSMAEIPINFLKTKPSTTSTASGGQSSTVKPSSATGNGPVLPKSLIPDSVKNAGKRPAQTKLDEIRAKYLKQDANVRIVSRSGGKKNEAKAKAADSDDSDDDSAGFFSFDSGIKDVDEATLEKLKLPLPDFNELVQAPSSSAYGQELEDEDMEDTSNEHVYQAAAQQADIMKYVQPKKGKGKTDLNIIDVSADDLRSDSTEWVKNITDESALPARRAKGVGGILKRKHQITYLAVEAKAREQELQQQWAQNRQTKRQSRMKYGF